MTITERAGDGAEYTRILNAIYALIGGGAAVDLGCGEAHTTKNWPMCTLVDLVQRASADRWIEALDIRLAPALFAREQRKYNLTVISDVIEHLTRADGDKLIADMEPITKAMFIFTPIGPYKLDENSKDPDVHKSAWTPEEFEALGWQVWAWPNYHPFVGSFYAWKWNNAVTPSVDIVAKAARVAV